MNSFTLISRRSASSFGNRNATLMLAALLATAAWPTYAHAQDKTAQSTEAAGVGADIIVTAQKREQLLTDVPMSITAISGDDLIERGISRPADLEKAVSSFTYQVTNFGQPVYAIRGVGYYVNFAIASPGVSTYLNEVPVPYSSMSIGLPLDLARVEVLKGPQGTLFGQNSTGGAVNFIAARPTEDTHAGFNLEYGRFNAVNAEGHLSGSLAPGLRARLAVRREYMDAWQQGYAPNDAVAASAGKNVGEELGRRDFTTARFSLDWDATENLTFQFTAHGWQDKSETQAQHLTAYVSSRPSNPLDPNSQVLPYLASMPRNPRLAGWDSGRDYRKDDSYYQLSLRGDLMLDDGLKLTSISSYNHYKQDQLVDVDAAPVLVSSNVNQAKITSYFQELRLSGDAERLNWLIGANYSNDYGDTDGNEAQGSPFLQGFDASGLVNTQKSETWAAYGNVEYELVDNVHVQLAARYTDASQSVDGCVRDTGSGQLAAAFQMLFGSSGAAGTCQTILSPGVHGLAHDSFSEDNISWKAGVDWKITPDAMVYVNVSKGYKSGSFPSIPATTASQYVPVKQESLLSYEAGFKVSLLDRRLQLSGAAYYYDYQDKQILADKLFAPLVFPLPTLVNIPKSRAYGAEVELLARPFDGLTLRFNGTYINTRIESSPADIVNQLGQPLSLVGLQFPNTPKWQSSTDIEYKLPTDGIRPFVGASLKTRSQAYSSVTTDSRFIIDGYALLDLRAGVESADGDWRLQVWGRNVTNKYYVQNINLAGGVLLAESTGMPATYGVTLSFNY